MSAPERRAFREGEGVESQTERGGRRHVELGRGGFQSAEADHPHGNNKTDGSPHADGRVILDDIEVCALHARIGDGDRQRNGGHVEHHIQQHDPDHRVGIVDLRYEQQTAGTQQVEDRIEPLGIDPAIGNDAGDSRHKDRSDTQGRKDRSKFGPRPPFGLEPPGSDSDQPGTPDKELQEIEDDQAQLKTHNAIYIIWSKGRQFLKKMAKKIGPSGSRACGLTE